MILASERAAVIGDNNPPEAMTPEQAEQYTAAMEAVHGSLVNALVEAGLYRKEAVAMVETWKDSWFEEGMRVIYLVPRSTIDRELPLTIQPNPKELTRVFVGRVEILSPWMEGKIKTALTEGQVDQLTSYGRFLEPFLAQIRAKDAALVRAASSSEYLNKAFAKIFNAPQTCVD